MSTLSVENKYTDDIASGNTLTDLSEVLASGKRMKLEKVGCCAPVGSDGVDAVIKLEWGDDENGWEVIRMLSKTIEVLLDRILDGDGAKRLKLTRNNPSDSTKEVFAYYSYVKET